MSTKPNKRTVTPRPDGKWAVNKPGAERASAVTDTQKEAQDRGREILKNQGGGELATKNRQGQIRQQDTVAPGNDPRTSKG